MKPPLVVEDEAQLFVRRTPVCQELPGSGGLNPTPLPTYNTHFHTHTGGLTEEGDFLWSPVLRCVIIYQPSLQKALQPDSKGKVGAQKM